MGHSNLIIEYLNNTQTANDICFSHIKIVDKMSVLLIGCDDVENSEILKSAQRFAMNEEQKI